MLSLLLLLPPLLLLLLTRLSWLLFYAKDDSKNCESGRWVAVGEAVAALHSSNNSKRKSDKKWKVLWATAAKIAIYRGEQEHEEGEREREEQKHPPNVNWPWGILHGCRQVGEAWPSAGRGKAKRRR